MAKSRPFVILSAAISVDGKIATKIGDSKLSSRQDKVRLHRLRSKVDGILIGKNTVVRDDPLLTVRHVKGKSPTRIIVDSKGSISSRSKILQSSDKVPTILAVSKRITQKNLKRLGSFPVEILKVGQKEVDIKALLQRLSSRGIKTLMLEGGGTINWQFLKKKFVDEIIVTLTPCLIGGRDSISLVEGKGFKQISESVKLELVSTSRQSNEVVLRYRIV